MSKKFEFDVAVGKDSRTGEMMILEVGKDLNGFKGRSTVGGDPVHVHKIKTGNKSLIQKFNYFNWIDPTANNTSDKEKQKYVNLVNRYCTKNNLVF